MGLTPEPHWVPYLGFNLKFYTDYVYTRVDASPLVGDRVPKTTTKCHQIATTWSHLVFVNNIKKTSIK